MNRHQLINMAVNDLYKPFSYYGGYTLNKGIDYYNIYCNPVTVGNVKPVGYWDIRYKKHKGLQATGFKRRGPGYNYWAYKRREDVLNRCFTLPLVRLNSEFEDYVVLDYGCGLGYWSKYWLQQGARRVYGVDNSLEAVRHCTQAHIGNDNNPNSPTGGASFFFYDSAESYLEDFELMQADPIWGKIRPYEFGFDVISAFDVLFHITNDSDWSKTVDSLVKLLAPNGSLLITDFFPREDRKPAKHVKARSLDTYLKLLEDAKAEMIFIEPVFYTMQPPPSKPKAALWHTLAAPFVGGLGGYFLYCLDGYLDHNKLPNGDGLKLALIQQR